MKKSVLCLLAAALLLTGCNDITTINPNVVYGDTDGSSEAESSPVAPSEDTVEGNAADSEPADTTTASEDATTVPEDTTSQPETDNPSDTSGDVPVDRPIATQPSATTTTAPEPVPEETTAPPVKEDIPFDKSDEQLRLERLVAQSSDFSKSVYGEPGVIPLFFGDLDGDGTEELAAVYGGTERYTDSSGRYFWGEVWFASGENAERLDKNLTGEYVGVELINNADGVFLKFEDMYVTGSLTNWVKLEHSKAHHVILDGFAQMNLHYTDEDELIAYHSTYDFSSDGTGHTWKPYWYYYCAPEKKFIQYDAADITEKQFLAYKGAKEALTGIKKGYTPVRYLKFDNGVIAVNCTSGERIDDDGEARHINHYFIYRTDGGRLTDITNLYGSVNEGFYITSDDYKSQLEDF